MFYLNKKNYNIGPGCKCLPGTNTLAYSAFLLKTKKFFFIILTTGVNIIKKTLYFFVTERQNEQECLSWQAFSDWVVYHETT